MSVVMRVVLVHGLWHGGWCWDAVRSLLDGAGVASVAPDLPMTTLADDVATVRQVIDDAAEPVLLVGHSYGGAVITAAGEHPSVKRLVYLAAFQLDETESIGRTLPECKIPPTRLGEALVFSADGTGVSVDPLRGAPLLYAGVAAVEVTRSLALLRPVSRALFSGVPAVCSWRTRPSTYAICADDLVVAPDLQRLMAERANDVIEWPSGHACIQSRPDLVAQLLIDLVTA
jgi:pimeloyl-ACP methyl ester carboxylesterase